MQVVDIDVRNSHGGTAVCREVSSHLGLRASDEKIGCIGGLGCVHACMRCGDSSARGEDAMRIM